MAHAAQPAGYGGAPRAKRLVAADLDGPPLSVGGGDQLLTGRVRAVFACCHALVVPALGAGFDFSLARLAPHAERVHPEEAGPN
jgi:hypothetical protein